MEKKTYSKSRAAPELIVADAPTAPRFGGKGLKENTIYRYEGENEDEEELQEHEKRTGATLQFLSLVQSK